MFVNKAISSSSSLCLTFRRYKWGGRGDTSVWFPSTWSPSLNRIKRIETIYNTCSGGNTAIYTVISLLRGNKVPKSNPNCQIHIEPQPAYIESKLKLVWSDDSENIIECHNRTYQDIIQEWSWYEAEKIGDNIPIATKKDK